jgi:hypothetical protein
MRAVNFRLSATRYLTVGASELDLHNDFEFESLTFNPIDLTVTLLWRRCGQASASSALPTQVRLRCEGVATFAAKPGSASLPSSDARCLSSIGYCSAEEPEQFWVEGAPEHSWVWSFQFQSGAEFRVSGAEVYATIEP